MSAEKMDRTTLVKSLLSDLEKMLKDGKRIMITGGKGLVGSGIQRLVKELSQYEQYKESFLFLSRWDGDLQYAD